MVEPRDQDPLSSRPIPHPNPTDGEERKGFTLPIWLHVTLAIAGGLAGASLTVMWVQRHMDYVLSLGIREGTATFAAVMIGMTLPMLAMKLFVPARCGYCGGAAWLRLGETLTYHCNSCGFITDTGISEGDD
jgi:hypothetical protein